MIHEGFWAYNDGDTKNKDDEYILFNGKILIKWIQDVDDIIIVEKSNNISY